MADIRKKLYSIRQRILTSAAEVANYMWDDEFKEKSLTAAVKNKKTVFEQKLSPVTIEELKTLSKEELYKEGFGNWSDELVLVPLWLLHYLSENTELTSINGGLPKAIKEIDTDHRAGFLAYGFYL